MWGDDPIQSAYRELRERELSPHRRGREFEGLLAQVFERAHFDVLRNAGAARPRQTDLFARDDDRAYLIEAKWRKKPATVADVDALRARLANTPAHVVGVLVSVSGFSATAIGRVETVRDRLVVLLDEADLETILGGVDLARLLRRKEASLLTHGRVRPGHSKRRRGPPAPVRRDQYLADTDGERASWIVSRGGFDAPAFSVELFDIDWVPAGGAGVTLDIPVAVASRAQLQDLLVALLELGWCTRAGQWTLRQSESVWYGIGHTSLRRSLEDQEARYRNAGEIHHTEQLVLADVCPGGWFTLTADLAAGSQHVYAAFLSAQLIGVPVDLRPLMRLCDRLHVDQELFFRPRNQPSVETHHVDRSLRPVELDVRGWVVDADLDNPRAEQWARGVVAANPFWRSGANPLPIPDELPRALRDVELMLCDLRDWHPLTEPRPAYVLTTLEWAHSSEALVVRALAHWPGTRARVVRQRAPSASWSSAV